MYAEPPCCLLQNSPTQRSYFSPTLPFPFSPWEEISFPFRSCELSNDVMLTEFPQLQRSLLTSAMPFATIHSCFQKKKKGAPANLSHLSFSDWERYDQTTETLWPLQSYKQAWWKRGWDLAFLETDKVEDKVLWCWGAAFVLGMTLIILLWPLRLAGKRLSFHFKLLKMVLVWEKAQGWKDGKSWLENVFLNKYSEIKKISLF